MSRPVIELNLIDRDNAFNNIIASIALQEAALGHILNAEGEKIQTAIAIPNVSIGELIDINNNVAATVRAIAETERNLASKLQLVLDFIELEAEVPEPVSFPLSVRKIDNLGNPLDGGLFALRNDLGLNIEESASDGMIDFGEVKSGNYTLQELTPPDGFLSNPTIYNVEISNTGVITINSIPLINFAIVNNPEL